MARTKASACRTATGGKATRKAVSSGGTPKTVSSSSTGSSSKSSGGSKKNKGATGQNSFCKRATPEWQKKITLFMNNKSPDDAESSSKANDEEMSDEIEIDQEPQCSSKQNTSNIKTDSEDGGEEMSDNDEESGEDITEVANNTDESPDGEAEKLLDNEASTKVSGEEMAEDDMLKAPDTNASQSSGNENGETSVQISAIHSSDLKNNTKDINDASVNGTKEKSESNKIITTGSHSEEESMNLCKDTTDSAEEFKNKRDEATMNDTMGTEEKQKQSS